MGGGPYHFILSIVENKKIRKKNKRKKQAKVDEIKSNPWDPHEQTHPGCPLASKGAEAHAGPQTYMHSHTVNKYNRIQ